MSIKILKIKNIKKRKNWEKILKRQNIEKKYIKIGKKKKNSIKREQGW